MEIKHGGTNNWQNYLTKYINKDKPIKIIDVGAFKGGFTDFIESYCGIEKGILVEPIPENYSFLEKKYNLEKLKICPNALSDKDNVQIDFFVNKFAETSSLFPFKADLKELSNVNTSLLNKIKVISKTLDTVCGELNFEGADILKIDVQGAEHIVLQGSKKILRRTRFCWVETSFKPLYENSAVFNDIYDFMSEEGFILLEISPGHRSQEHELLQADLLFFNEKLNKQ